MLSRALSLATVTLLIGCFAAVPAWAQATNLEAGKSPSQIFAGTCTACHKGPRGLLKTVPAGSLQGFLRQHYTTSPEMASLLASFLVSNGAADTRYAQPKEGAKSGPSAGVEQLDRFGRRLRPAPPQEAAKPEAEPREAAKPASERGPDGRKLSVKQMLGKRGKPGSEEPPKTEAAGKEEPAKGEAIKEDAPKSETAKVEDGKVEDSKPSGDAKPESAKIEAPKESGNGDTTVLRADPVPPVTPAPPVASPTVSAAVSGGTPEPAAVPSAPPPAAPAVTASAPPPVAPAGPPAPPISQ
jgi:hypothetical protein